MVDASFVSKQEENAFLLAVHQAKGIPRTGDEMPSIEAPRKVIEHFFRGRTQGLEKTHYVVFENVKVFEEGKREEGERVDRLTTEDLAHGGKTK